MRVAGVVLPCGIIIAHHAFEHQGESTRIEAALSTVRPSIPLSMVASFSCATPAVGGFLVASSRVSTSC